jgi:hypothetical protein
MIDTTRRLRALGMGLIVLSMIACGLAQPTSTPPPAEPAETRAPDTAEPTVTPTATDAPAPTPTPLPTDTRVPTDTPEPTDTPQPTPTRTSRPTEKPSPTNSPTAVPTSTPKPPPTATPVPPAAPTQPPPPPPSSGVLSTFLSDARQTQADLLEVKIWFDRLAGSESVACSTVFAHSIHTPVSNAPAQDPELVEIWHEYEGALASGQLCLQWLVDFCSAGGGTIDYGTFWDRRELSSDALSRAEHVVQALEARQ